MKLTLAITVFNRYDLLLESFAQVIDDPRIDEVLIMDDASEAKYWDKIKELPKFNDKIKVVRQLTNQNMSRNKRDAIFNSKNDWVILFDSDNVIGKDYLDAIPFLLHENIIYCPGFAKPHFDYRRYGIGKDITSENAKKYFSDPAFNCLLNTANYLVHKESYTHIWRENKEVKGSDTIWFNYLWLLHGRCFRVLNDMQYMHRVHPGSAFAQDMSYNMAKAEEIKKLIMGL